MIFQHTIDKVLDGTKTQTRRLAAKHADGFSIAGLEMIGFPNGVKSVMHGDKSDEKWNVKYQVGKTYAVQSGRGKKQVARIELVDLRYEDVRCISYEDAQAEGFNGKLEFLETWVKMHDHTRQFFKPDALYRQWRGVGRKWETADAASILDCLADRPDQYYHAWVLEFKLVEPS